MHVTEITKEIKSDNFTYRIDNVDGKVDIIVFDKNSNILLNVSLDQFKSLMSEFATLLKEI